MGSRASTIISSIHRPTAGFCLAVCITAAASTATAQTYQGGVRGAVHDANGVVPGAEVVLINEETTLPRATVTNGGVNWLLLGSRSERLTVGGTSDGTININQLNPKYLALGTALQDALPNPFFGMSDFGVFATQPTLQRGQLLRP